MLANSTVFVMSSFLTEAIKAKQANKNKSYNFLDSLAAKDDPKVQSLPLFFFLSSCN